eukprot:TCONS_00020389-protein
MEKESWNDAVCSKFGIEHLKEYQIEAINCLSQQKKELFVVQPTGSGKSLIFFSLPVIKEEGIVLVISPLTSLIKDQMTKLEAVGIKSVHLMSKFEEEQEVTARGDSADVVEVIWVFVFDLCALYVRLWILYTF